MRLNALIAELLPGRDWATTLPLAGTEFHLMQTLIEGAAAAHSMGTARPEAEKSPRDCIFPASFPQQRLWFLQQLDPASAYYNIPRVIRVKGPLYIQALTNALQAVVSRHESLRTRFVQDTTLMQVIEDVTAAVHIVDLRALDFHERQTRWTELVKEEIHKSFDLSIAPLIRYMIIRLEARDHIVVVVLHHIASDGWSNKILVDEISAFYKAFLFDQPCPLKPLRCQYTDFAVWQRNLLQGPVLERHLSYWRQRLDGAKIIEVPTDKPRPAYQSFRGADLVKDLPQDVAQDLRTFAEQTGMPLFVILLAAFNVLLTGYSGQYDVTVGTPIANRTRIEFEDLIGFFVNTLVLRTDLSGDPPFSTVLQRTREVTQSAYEHQDLPFEMLVEELQPTRDLARNPYFQVMFTLQSNAIPDLQLPGVDTMLIRSHTATSKFDLSLDVLQSSAGICLCLEYNSDLFEESAPMVLDHYAELLEAALKRPQERISQLPPFARTGSQELEQHRFSFDTFGDAI